MDKEKAQKMVREAYGRIAEGDQGCGCGCDSCGPDPKGYAKAIGYSEQELSRIPEEANLALGCGNPTALAGLKKGQTVLDLGAGAGFDCFLAASQVGAKGKVIGVDMTPEMVSRARENAKKTGAKNVEFRLGEIENLPAPDNSVDVVISNCVINLSADKPRTFQEVYRVLKKGGKIAISDIALTRELPNKIRESIAAYVGCIAGAVVVEEYQRMVQDAGFKDVKVIAKGPSICIAPETKDPLGRAFLDILGKNESLDGYIVSVSVEGYK